LISLKGAKTFHVSTLKLCHPLKSFVIAALTLKTGLAANAVLASNAEIHLAMICASAPAGRALFRHYFNEPPSNPADDGSCKSWTGGRKYKFGSISFGTTQTWASGLTSGRSTCAKASFETDRQVILKDIKLIPLTPIDPLRVHGQVSQSVVPGPLYLSDDRTKYHSHKSFGETHEQGITQSRQVSVAYETLVPEVPALPTCACGMWHSPHEEHWPAFSTIRL